MKNTLKSVFAVGITPVLLILAFQSNQIKTNVGRSPAVTEQVSKQVSLKTSIERYLIVNAKNM